MKRIEIESSNPSASPIERCKLEKVPASTDPHFGCQPEARPMREYIEKGVVVIDKPAGPTAHEVVSWVKGILKVNKAAHTGTLDPKVTGVLPILLGIATKLAGVFVSDKEYVCLMRLHGDVEEDKLREVVREFEGKIYQRPPLKSAVKRRIRVRTVHYIEIKEVEGREVLMKVGCEAGTYIRMLCHHIGLALGVGAHMAQLRRTKSLPFDEAALTKLQDLKDAYVFYEAGEETPLRELIMPMEYALGHLHSLRCIIVKDTAVDALCHGADLAAPGISRIEEGINIGNPVVMYTYKGEAVCAGRALMSSEEMLRAEEGICVNTDRVFMKPGTYMRAWKSEKSSRGG
ncbi:MAG: RNA-guided pseudouridylation complex pseudouridine synthase subunit Cbf5 [Candidatus Methanophagaceae archaeon]|nr:MAG: RNA-guided pseudouridylation complex pseudouridine synthase subunit Cbf5 [Methanophagales archaeon]